MQQYMCGNTANTEPARCDDNADYAKERVELKLSWSMPHPDNRVEWTWWTSSADPFSSQLKTQFRPVAAAIGKQAKLSLRYSVVAGADIGCYPKKDQKDAGLCGRQCTNEGRYCAPTWPVPSSFVVEENLRQLCLFQTTETGTLIGVREVELASPFRLEARRRLWAQPQVPAPDPWRPHGTGRRIRLRAP